MNFQHDGKRITIKGDPSLTKTRVSLKHMMKIWDSEDQSYLIECRALHSSLTVEEMYDEETKPTVKNLLPRLLTKFDDVFSWPETLPPQRGIEHHIHLKEGTDPVNVRPCRYVDQQKEEMECLVDEMLAQELFGRVPVHIPVPCCWQERKMGVDVFVLIIER